MAAFRILTTALLHLFGALSQVVSKAGPRTNIIVEELNVPDIPIDLNTLSSYVANCLNTGLIELKNITVTDLTVPGFTKEIAMPNVAINITNIKLDITAVIYVTTDPKPVGWLSLSAYCKVFPSYPTPQKGIIKLKVFNDLWINMDGQFIWKAPETNSTDEAGSADPGAHLASSPSTRRRRQAVAMPRPKSQTAKNEPAPSVIDAETGEFPKLGFAASEKCAADNDPTKITLALSDFADTAVQSKVNTVIDYAKSYLGPWIMKTLVCSTLVNNVNQMLETQDELLTKILAFLVGRRYEKGVKIETGPTWASKNDDTDNTGGQPTNTAGTSSPPKTTAAEPLSPPIQSTAAAKPPATPRPPPKQAASTPVSSAPPVKHAAETQTPPLPKPSIALPVASALAPKQATPPPVSSPPPKQSTPAPVSSPPPPSPSSQTEAAAVPDASKKRKADEPPAAPEPTKKKCKIACSLRKKVGSKKD